MITQPHRDYPIVDERGIASIDSMLPWITSITNLVNALNIVEGAGSPEGVVFEKKKKLYFNTSGSAGTLIYIKSTDETVNTGWVAIG